MCMLRVIDNTMCMLRVIDNVYATCY
jgi:hypothetical protein